MRTITLATQKGGSDKSTLAACLAVAAVADGLKVAVLDSDPQGSLDKWGDRRAVEAPHVEKWDPHQVEAKVKALQRLKSRDQVTVVGMAKPARDRRSSPGDVVRNGYHASVYLPKEAQFAVREIALHLRLVKPHAVFLEAFADLFDKYHKPDLAAECRRRINPREDDLQ